MPFLLMSMLAITLGLFGIILIDRIIDRIIIKPCRQTNAAASSVSVDEVVARHVQALRIEARLKYT